MKIFFDLDGTLIDVSQRHHRVYSEIVIEMGGSPLEKAMYWDLKRDKTDWETILPQSNISADQKNIFLEKFISKIEAIEYLRMDTLFTGVIEQLEKLSQDHNCYLVSLRRNHDNLVAEIDWLELSPYFSKVLSGHSESDGSDVKSEIIMQQLGEEEGIIIGDTEADVVTGNQLNMKTVAVLSGIRNQKFLNELNPDYLLQDVSELSTVL